MPEATEEIHTSLTVEQQLEQQQAQYADLCNAFHELEAMLNSVGRLAASTTSRALALHRILVFKGVVSHEELLELEGKCMAELSGQAAQAVQEPKMEPIIKPN